MSAKINNFPIYVVYDRTYQLNNSSITTYGTTGAGIVSGGLGGGYKNMWDKNLSSYYGYLVESNGVNTNLECWITIDLGKQYWNINLTALVLPSLSINYVTLNDTFKVYSSLDNFVSGIVYEHTPIVTGTPAYNYSINIITARYIRFYGRIISSNTLPKRCGISIYELKFMASD